MIAIIDYDAGNLTSVQRAVSHLGIECVITKKAPEIEAAERIIFPGVGAAGAAMQSLQRNGLDRVIKDAFAVGKPVLVSVSVRKSFWRIAKKMIRPVWELSMALYAAFRLTIDPKMAKS